MTCTTTRPGAATGGASRIGPPAKVPAVFVQVVAATAVDAGRRIPAFLDRWNAAGAPSEHLDLTDPWTS